MDNAKTPSMVEQLGSWAADSRWENVSENARGALKARVLDSIGCAIGAMEAKPIQSIRQMTEELGGNPLVTLIGGGSSSPDYASFFNGAAIRYLDFKSRIVAMSFCEPRS